MKKISLVLVPIFLAIVLLAAFNQGEKNENSDQPVAKKVEIVPAQESEFQKSIFATGKLASKEEMKLSFKTGGIIKKILVREGQTIRKGQLLAELSLDEIDAQVQQAQLGVQQSDIRIKNARLALQMAERDYRNIKALYADSVATLEQLENTEIQLNNARNQLQAAETGLDFSKKSEDIARFNLEHSRIVAPSNGLVLKKLAESNEMVGPGTALFLFGSKDKAQVIRVNLTDKDIIHVNLGDGAKVEFDAYPQTQFKGTVREIARMADPFTGTYEVEIEIDDQGKQLLSGFIGKVDIQTRQNYQVMSIPIDALVAAEKDRGEIFTIEEGKAKRLIIQILKVDGEKLLVNSGLNEGQAVVVSGAGFLREGEEVEGVTNDE